MRTDELARKTKATVDEVSDREATGSIGFVQAERVAAATHTPFGQMFLSAPPQADPALPDFRTVNGASPADFSPNLLDTLHLMQRRQAWMRDFLLTDTADAIEFVGSATIEQSVEHWVGILRTALGLEIGWAARARDTGAALKLLRERSEAIGVLIVFNGVVGNNTSRKLDPDEFRGFALVDEFAPLVFVNAADTKPAQIFTLVHELMHLVVGEGGVSDLDLQSLPRHGIEARCNAAAAEFLVPAKELELMWSGVADAANPFAKVAGRFKVSTIVAARRALDCGLIDRDQFFAFHERYVELGTKAVARTGGGDFWATQGVRIGERFGSAVVRAAREGRLPYKEAWSLTGLEGDTFDRYAEQHAR